MASEQVERPEPVGLCVMWVSGDREVALNAALMYAHNARRKGWWERVRCLVWGPAAKLLATDRALQKKVKEMATAGVEVLACRRCAMNYKVVEELEALGVDVIYAGEPLTDMLKDGWSVLTY
ncbi:MAG: DsrE family protein [Desulfovibrionaceae bacterium]|jgi:hypothetical protein|nr:DsrE family protein [Desulfovibrionaceae bacterium]